MAKKKSNHVCHSSFTSEDTSIIVSNRILSTSVLNCTSPKFFKISCSKSFRLKFNFWQFCFCDHAYDAMITNATLFGRLIKSQLESPIRIHLTLVASILLIKVSNFLNTTTAPSGLYHVIAAKSLHLGNFIYIRRASISCIITFSRLLNEIDLRT